MYNFGSLILLRFLQTLERPTQITPVLLAMIYQQLSALHMPSFMIGWLVKEREKKPLSQLKTAGVAPPEIAKKSLTARH